MCDPGHGEVRRRLSRRGLLNEPLLEILWDAYSKLLDEAHATWESGAAENYAVRWHDSVSGAFKLASEDLRSSRERITTREEYLDLLEVRASQILLRDVNFVEPLLDELRVLLRADDATVICIDCTERFSSWVDSLHQALPGSID